MPRSCPTQIRYGAGTINPAPKGRFDCFVWIDGKRHRSRQPNITMARSWIDMVEDANRLNRRPLTNIQMSDAQRAIGLLPDGLTLTDAARIATEHASNVGIKSATVRDALFNYIENKEAANIKPITIEAYEQIIGRLARTVGDPKTLLVNQIDQDHIAEYLKGMTPFTRNSKLSTLNAFFNWCKRQGYIVHSPTERVPKAREPEPSRAVFSIKDAGMLMKTAIREDPSLVLYLAIGLFAGVRPEELRHLKREKIGHEFIILDGSVTKTSRARTVSIRANLRQWVDSCAGSDLVAPTTDRRLLYKKIEALCTAAGVSWIKDGMRHSFATYAYEQTKDAAFVAAEMGHRGTDIFFRHYRAMAHPGDGEKFFSIRP